MFLKNKRLSFKIGMVLALAHFILFVFFVATAILPGRAQWQLAWFFFITIDFPISLLLFPLLKIVPHISIPIGFLPYPMTELREFWMPCILFGVFGTLWYFYLPIIIVTIIKKIKRLLAPK